MGYSVVLQVADRRCLVVGGGSVAVAKVHGLLEAGANVVVVAPEIDPRLRDQVAGPVALVGRPFEPRDLDGVWLVITCTNDPEVNRSVAAEAERRTIWVNSADDVDNCSFILPSVARVGDLSLSVSTGGRSPALAAWARRRFELELLDGWPQLLDLLASARSQLRRETGTSESPGWRRALDDDLLGLIRSDGPDAARRVLDHHLEAAEAST